MADNSRVEQGAGFFGAVDPAGLAGRYWALARLKSWHDGRLAADCRFRSKPMKASRSKPPLCGQLRTAGQADETQAAAETAFAPDTRRRSLQKQAKSLLERTLISAE